MHELVWVGWGQTEQDWYYHWHLSSALKASFQPISFTTDSGSGGERFGSFRLLNVEAFHNYLTGRFYDPIYYAPKDEIALDSVREQFESPEQFAYQGFGNLEWTTYCLSPAALFHPQVMRNVEDGGWQDPWLLVGAFRTPGFSQARYPSLKTQIMEHHWLQGTPMCHPPWAGATSRSPPHTCHAPHLPKTFACKIPPPSGT